MRFLGLFKRHSNNFARDVQNGNFADSNNEMRFSYANRGTYVYFRAVKIYIFPLFAQSSCEKFMR